MVFFFVVTAGHRHSDTLITQTDTTIRQITRSFSLLLQGVDFFYFAADINPLPDHSYVEFCCKEVASAALERRGT